MLLAFFAFLALAFFLLLPAALILALVALSQARIARRELKRLSDRMGDSRAASRAAVAKREQPELPDKEPARAAPEAQLPPPAEPVVGDLAVAQSAATTVTELSAHQSCSPGDLSPSGPAPDTHPSPGREEAPRERDQEPTAAPQAGAADAQSPRTGLRQRRLQAGARVTARPARSKAMADWEDLLGRRLLTWVGILLLFLAAAFLVHLAYEQGILAQLLSPALRLALVLLAALAALGWGWRAQQRGQAPLGQGLLGAGIGLLMLAIYAAYQPGLLYPADDAAFIGPWTALAGMAACTLLGLILAIRLDAAALAHIALLCGLATPVLLSRGGGSRDVLCAWLWMLNAGAILAASKRDWPGLAIHAIAGSSLLLLSWALMQQSQQVDSMALTWLVLIHSLSLLPPMLSRYLGAAALRIEQLLLPGISALLMIAIAAVLVDAQSTPLALFVLVIAAVHGLQLLLCFPAPGLPRHLALLAIFMQVNLALALVLKADVLTLLWGLQSLLLFFAGAATSHQILRRTAYVALGIALYVGMAWFGRQMGSLPRSPRPLAEAWILAMLVPPLTWAGWWGMIRHFAARLAPAERSFAQVLGLAAGLGLGAAFLFEIGRLQFHAQPGWWPQRGMLPLIWGLLLLALAYAAWERPWKRRWAASWGLNGASLAVCMVLLAGLLTLLSYFDSRQLARLPLLGLRGLLSPAAILLLIGLARCLNSRWLNWLVLGFAILASTAEAASWTSGQYTDLRLTLLVVTGVWASWAGACLATGLCWNRQSIRLVGLGLAALAVAKLLLIDLAGLGTGQRLIISLIVGGICFAGGIGYQRLLQRGPR